MKRDNIMIYTDGSSLGNPGPGGWGVVMLYPDDRIVELGGGAKLTTNNKMELTAVIEAAMETECDLEEIDIYTDSKYVVEGITKWVKGWQERDWKTIKKEKVQNKDFWEKLIKATENRQINWHHVPGHVGLAGNERADIIATSYAKEDEPGLYVGDLSEYGEDISDASYDETKKQERSDARVHSRAKAYSYVSLVDGNVQVHKTWAECESCVKGRQGVKYKKVLNKEEEEKLVKEWSK